MHRESVAGNDFSWIIDNRGQAVIGNVVEGSFQCIVTEILRRPPTTHRVWGLHGQWLHMRNHINIIIKARKRYKGPVQ